MEDREAVDRERARNRRSRQQTVDVRYEREADDVDHVEQTRPGIEPSCHHAGQWRRRTDTPCDVRTSTPAASGAPPRMRCGLLFCALPSRCVSR